MLLVEFFSLRESANSLSKPLYVKYVKQFIRLLMTMYKGDGESAEACARTIVNVTANEGGEPAIKQLYISFANAPNQKRRGLVSAVLDKADADPKKAEGPSHEIPRTHAGGEAKPKLKPKPKPKDDSPPAIPGFKKKSAWEDDDEGDDESELGPDMEYDDPTADRPSKSTDDDDDDWEEELKAKAKKPAGSPPKSLRSFNDEEDDDELLGPEEPEFKIPDSHKRATAKPKNKDDDDSAAVSKKDLKQMSQAADRYAKEFASKHVKSFANMSDEEKEKMRQQYGSGPTKKPGEDIGYKPTGKYRNIGPSY